MKYQCVSLIKALTRALLRKAGSSRHWFPKVAGCRSRCINVQRCGGLYMVLLQLKDPLERSVNRRKFLLGSGFLSRRDMTSAVESDIKPHTLPYLTK